MTHSDTQREGEGSQTGLRRANARRVVETLRREGPSSQALLARRSGLSRATVNNIVHSLVGEGVVRITDGPTGRESTVSLVAATGSLVALDVSHRLIRGSLVSFEQQSRFDELVDLGRDPEARADVAALTTVVERLLERSDAPREDILQVCVALRAPYDSIRGRAHPTSFLPALEEVDIKAALEQNLQLPVFVDNDANFSALAEWAWGAAGGADHFYYVESSESIGSGFVLHGYIYRGSNGAAGEIGHVVVDARGTLCTCGSRGCLAAVASGRAILLQLQAAGNPQPSVRAVIEGAHAGDPSCVCILGEAGQYLGQALSHVVRILAPSVVVIGGSLAAAGPLVINGVRAALDARSLGGGAPQVRVAVGMLRGDMCTLGCVVHVLMEHGGGISELPEWLLKPVPRLLQNAG